MNIGLLSRAVCALSLLTLASAVQAQDYINTDTTIDSSNSHYGNVYVGQYGSGDPMVNLVPGGIVGGFLQLLNNSTLNMTGGHIGDFGSAYGFLSAGNSTTINIFGGSIRDQAIYASENATVSFYGTGLYDTLLTPNDNGYSDYRLYGTLRDGTDITGYQLLIYNFGNQPAINFINTASVPEPGSVALLLSGIIGTGYAFRRRKPIFSGE